jgi:peptidoglycan L-alanyl-D-glutamate endopeptidase CwlK
VRNLCERIRLVQRRLGVDNDGKVGTLTIGAVERLLDVRDMIEAPLTGEEDPAGADLDDRTAETINTLDPHVRESFRQFARMAAATAAAMGCDYVAISGNRTYAEQNEIYAQGRTKPGKVVTKARGGYSNHNFGIAADFGVFRGLAYLDNSDTAMAAQVHRACSVHAAECGLTWGGSWETFKDLPHYEFSTGLTMPEKRQLVKSKGGVI